MPIKVPLAVNYQSPIVLLPAVWNNDQPLEGAGYVPIEIDWGTMGGANKAVSINMNNNVQSPNTMSQIVALTCDNSDCGVDVIFVFPDTSQTITIPAGEPNVTVPVFTRSVFFYVLGTGAGAADQTRALFHNVMPPPVAVPESVEQQFGSGSNIATDGSTSMQIVPAGVSGRIEGVTIFFGAVCIAETNMECSLVDGTGEHFAQGNVVLNPAGAAINVMAVLLNPCEISFSDGLKFEQSTGAGPANGFWTVNVAYKVNPTQ